MTNRTVVLVVLAILCSLVSSSVSAYDDSAMRQQLARMEPERQKLGLELLDGMKLVAQKHGGDDVAALVAMACQEGVFARPKGDGIETFDGNPLGARQIALVLTIPKDSDSSSVWSKLNQEEFAACYDVQKRWLIIPQMPLSRTMRGVTGLSALYCVKMHQKDERLDSALIEVLEYDLKDDLLLHIGGEAYKKLVGEHADRMYRALEDFKKDPGSELDDGQYDQRFEAVLGPSASEKERTMRQNDLWVISCWQMLKHHYPDDALKLQCQILKALKARPAEQRPSPGSLLMCRR